MKKTAFLLSALLLPFYSFGATTWNLNGNEFKVDTIQHVKIGPATTETSLSLSGPKNLRVFYTTTDLTNQNVDVRTVKANNTYASCATVSGMAEKATSQKGKLYFAGVNADFFGNNAPIGHSLVDGEIYRTLGTSYWPSFGITYSKKPIIGTENQIVAKIKIDGAEHSVTGINRSRGENDLILYTHLMGSTTGANPYGTEIALESVDGNQAIIGRTSKMRVTGTAVAGTGSMTIPSGGFVLSAHGTSQAIINALTVGTEVELTAWARYDGVDVMDIAQMAGGNPEILKNGEVLDTEGALDHLVANNPRTAVGYNSLNQLVMLVVDGRSTISAGCISKELADIMKNVGCTEAMNFDGGGSSTMYAGPMLGVLNRTSDGKERSVTNGLFLVATGDHNDTEIAEIAFKDADEKRMVRIPQYGIYTPSFFAFNKDEVLLDTDMKGVRLSLEGDNQDFGEIINDGTTLYVTAAAGTFMLTAEYNGVKKNVPVAIQPGEVSFKYRNIIIDNSRKYAVEVFSTLLESTMPLDNRALDWTSADTEIASVEDITGIVRGIKEGETTVTGTLGDFTGTLNVKVEIPTSEVMPVVEAVSATEWKLSQLGGTGISISGLDKGFALNYTGNGFGRGAYITAERTSRIWSLPEKIRIRINPGISSVTKLSLDISNALGANEPSWTICGTELPKEQESLFEASLSDVFDTTDIGIYPITINSIRLDMNKSEKGKEFEIQVPGFEAVYSAGSSIGSLPAANAARIYPNPVASGAAVTVESDGAAAVTVYTLGGAQVMSAVTDGRGEISTAGLLPGMYVVKVTTADATATAKLIVK